jgi:hypothetical protein
VHAARVISKLTERKTKMSKRKELTQAEYNWVRDAIDGLLKPFRRSHELNVEATRAIIEAIVAEASALFTADTAPEFISDVVNDSLEFEAQV